MVLRCSKVAATGTDISQFSIIYGNTALDHDEHSCNKIAEFICGQLNAALGVTLPVYSDTEHPYTKGVKEILIGKTNREGADNFPELSTAFTEKQTRLGYEKPENWYDELDPDKWMY